MAESPESVVVHEIYRSIQGESSLAGRPCTLVRLTGCNLRCSWCDTPHAFTGGERMSVARVVEQVQALDTPTVLLTGGEPLLQEGARPLLSALCELGKAVMVETSGERDVGGLDPRVIRVMDLKAPGSGEDARNRWQNLELLGERDQIKVVLLDRTDYEWAREVIARERLSERVGEVLLSCVHGELDPQQLVAWVLEDNLDVRVNLQLHKLIWHPDKRGV